MRTDLRKPCKNCPFRRDENRIKFSCRERAEEIEESAYRHGFPCHRSADLVDDDESLLENGYYPGENTQLCVGFAIMQLNENGNSPWPGIGNDQDIIDKIDEAVDFETRRLVFEDSEEFFEANEKVGELDSTSSDD